MTDPERDALDRLRRADPLAGTDPDDWADRDHAAAVFARITAESRTATAESPGTAESDGSHNAAAESRVTAESLSPDASLSTEVSDRAEASRSGDVSGNARPEGYGGDDLSRRRGLRSPRVLGLAAAAVVIAVASALLIVSNLFRDTTATASAAELLRGAAAAAVTNPAGFQHIPAQGSAYQQVLHRTTYTGPGYSYSIDTTVRTQVRAGGQASVETTTGAPEFADDAARQAWERAGSPVLTGPVRGMFAVAQPLVYHLGGQNLTWAQVGVLPEDPVALAAALTAAAPHQSVYRSAVQLLQAPAVPAGLQAALYRVLSEQPDLTATEHAGTVSISRPGEATFTFDRATGQLLRVDRSAPTDPSTVIQSAGLAACVAPLSAAAPGEIYIGCATGAYILNQLRWIGWGEDQATATGTAGVRDCTPNCAAGPTTITPVDVTVSQPQVCGYNLRIYTRVDMRYPQPVKGLVNGGTGPDHSGTADWWNLACPKG
ncbi:hypothetical protein ACFXHA_35485 [Nocardia sp. NPDC059240]|uniref:hypothetical protein n=1 Tax=Nocardia sp. NPDC059240 TaxID=3346786 RepID=UPI00368AA857